MYKMTQKFKINVFTKHPHTWHVTNWDCIYNYLIIHMNFFLSPNSHKNAELFWQRTCVPYKLQLCGRVSPIWSDLNM